ncbi:MAG: T9SS type A sorting domain-containing protein [Bacteroidetes bacterium]|nr:T9SS type A sorting domain-containing protein [Bacteroidota bacterium]
MKKMLLLVICFGFISLKSKAQCSETDVTRVMLIGDSWANFIGLDNAINNSFEKWGHSNYKYFTNATLAENGTTTEDFLDPARLAEIQNQLNANPDIDLVHLSIGGNDVLNAWDVTFSQAQTDSLLDSVYAHIVTIIDFIKIARPGIRILWSGYAYPNFGEIIQELAPFQSSHPFYGTWQGMGFPTFTQLNGILNTYSVSMDTLAANDPQVEFVRAAGIMQYTFGQTTALSVPPGGTYAPYTVPMPDGYPDYPSPKNSMRTYVIFRDCFHLSPQGYNDFLEYQTHKFYHKALMDDQYFISEGGTHDGSVSSQGTVSTQLQMGTTGTEDFSTILSFNSTIMPDTGVSKASLFLRRELLTGTNPVGNNLQVKIVSGSFSASADVEASDYTAPGDATDSPCQFGSTVDNGHWIRLDLPASLLPFITQNAITQFMISAPGATGLIEFTDATDSEFAPVLNITYGPATVSIAENMSDLDDVFIYPNPTSGILVVESNKFTPLSLQVFDLPGKLILESIGNTSSIDISTLPQGMYVVKIHTGNKIISKRVIKK